MRKFKVALIQTMVYADKEKNVKNAVKMIDKVSKEGADIAVLPEMFCCPYNTSYFREYGEEEGGYAYKV
ncbi:MAG: carbon-nitrogen hydrolase family protein, partial [Sedimentibacter sp.]|nr:carbon-nitrogen hydrolase family protein [Sedimentibacter sp.]